MSKRALAEILAKAGLISAAMLAISILVVRYGMPDTPISIQFWLLVVLLSLPFSFSAATVWIDLGTPDHIAAWQFRTAEKPISLQRRLVRNLLLIVYPQAIALVYALTDLIATDQLTAENMGPIFILTSAMMATVGWLYTNYVSALKARHAATIQHFHQLNGDDTHREYASALKLFVAKYAVPDEPAGFGKHFPADDVQRLWDDSECVEVGDRSHTFRDVCQYFLGYLEHVALGVRVGIYDYDLMQRQRRRRLMLYYNTLFYVIVYQSGAMPVRGKWLRNGYDYKRGNDVWENFIWLMMKMDDRSRINSDIHPIRRIDPRRNREPRAELSNTDFASIYGRTREIDDGL